MVYKYNINTQREGFYNITSKANEALKQSGVTDGMLTVFCPHTTAGITINENADPDVVSDMLFAFNKTFPDRPEFMHMEGNTTAHIKASFVGSSVNVIIENGRLLLGTWQGIYFCEFDGPRSRKFFIKIMSD